MVGGMTGSGRPTTAVETIDLSTGQRGYAESLPEPRAFYAYAYTGDRFYVIGGSDPSGGATDTIYVYDPSADQWSSLGVSLPTPLARSCAAPLSTGEIIVSGGMDDQGNVVGATLLIDPSTPSIAQRAHMNTPRQNHACGVLADQYYVFGGDDGTGGLHSSIEQYSPAQDKWTTLQATLPKGLTGLTAAQIALNGKQYILILGG